MLGGAEPVVNLSTRLRGPARVYFRGSHWLGKSIDGLEVPYGAGLFDPQSSVTLANGDVDGDNGVTVFDYDKLSLAFDSSFGDKGCNADADLDGDGSVSVFDYDILSSEFDRVGDSL